MRGDGLRRPQNAPIAQGTPIGVQPGTQSITIAHIIIVTGPGGGVFIYSGTPGTGNPPVAWISNGTTDPYGNALPNGAEMGLAGSGIFSAGDTLVTPSGIFSYPGTPGVGGLAQSIVPGAVPVTDPFGNAALPGITTYEQSGGTWYANNLLASQLVIWTAASSAGPYTQSAAGLFFLTGANTFINALAGQKIELSAPVKADFALEVAGAFTADTTATVTGAFTATGGTASVPTLITTDSWNSLGALGAGSGYTVNRGRFQLTSEGETEIDIVLTAGAATVAGVYLFTVVLPTVPNYRPIDNRSYPMGWNGTVTAAMNFPSLRVGGTSTGTVNLQLPALPNGTVITCTQRIPLN